MVPYHFVRIALGCVLLAAALLKGHQLATSPVPETALFNTRWFLIGVVEFELIFSLWLFAGMFHTKTRWATMLCFAGFGVVSLYRAANGATSCQCFGNVPLNPWLVGVLDLCTVIALWFARPPIAICVMGRRDIAFRGFAVLVAFLLLGIPAAGVMACCRGGDIGADGEIQGDQSFVVLEPQAWLDKPFPLIHHIDIGYRFARGSWSLLFYHYDCPECVRAIAALQRASRLSQDSAVLVEVPPFAQGPVEIEANLFYARLNQDHRWFVASPVEIRLHDGIVVSVRTASQIMNQGESSD